MSFKRSSLVYRHTDVMSVIRVTKANALKDTCVDEDDDDDDDVYLKASFFHTSFLKSRSDFLSLEMLLDSSSMRSRGW